jgi:predicted nucleotidyltransferase
VAVFPLQHLLEEIIAFFEKRDVDYMIMGGIAVRFWSLPRPTFDLDFTVALAPEDVPALAAAFEEEGFTVHEAHRKGFLDRLSGLEKIAVVKYVGGKEIAVDLFLATTNYQKEAFRRRAKKTINGGKAWMISLEDLVLHKLIAGRDRDMADVGEMLLVNPRVDRVYLKRWSATLGVSKGLEKKLRAVEE